MRWRGIETAPKDGTIIICKTASGFVSSARYWSANFVMDNVANAGFIHPDEEFWGIVDPDDLLLTCYEADTELTPIQWLDEGEDT